MLKKPINAKLATFPAWNAASIERRHALLTILMQDVWKTTPIKVLNPRSTGCH